MVTRLTRLSGTIVLVLGLCTVAFELGARRGDPPGGLPPAFAVLEEVYADVSARGVEPPPDAALLDGAVEGMVEALGDEYAEYYDAQEFSALENALDGRFVGIGVVLEDTEVGLTVQTVLPDSPAERAGLEPGEQIVEVDGADVSDTPSDLVVDRVRGEEGSTVVLGLRGGSAGDREVSVVREQLEVPNTEARLLDGGVGYVALRQFTQGAGADVTQEVRALLDEGAQALVLDLRGNPGGYLPAAIDVANVFVSDAQVVRVGRDPETATEYRAEDDALAPDVPLAVLVDGGSASASEIVAGALQDLDRADLIGTTTFGKGTVQTITDLPDDRGLKFTTDRYYTPSGDSIDGVGIAPDRVVEDGEGEDDPQLDAAQQTLVAALSGSA